MHIVLGGTSGLGWELMSQLRGRDDRVIVLGQNHDAQYHGEGVRVDLYDPNDVEQAINQLQEVCAGQHIESFVWAAGYGYRGNFADQSNVRSMGEVNFAGALPVVQWAWRQMIGQDLPSKLVVLGSTSGIRTRPDNTVYVATKHAQTGFARALGEEAERLKVPVRVHLFVLGGMKTPFWTGWQPEDEEYSTFNDPHKVASKIVQVVDSGIGHYTETIVERGTLV